jgi:hypothetical protein
MSVVQEATVEYAAVDYFGTIRASTKRGIEIDDAGERSDRGAWRYCCRTAWRDVGRSYRR